MRQSVNPRYGHAEMGFKIATLHYGGESHYWKRCELCGKMGEVEIDKSGVFSRRYRSVVSSIRVGMSEAKKSALTERKARRDAGACLSCGVGNFSRCKEIWCRGTRKKEMSRDG